MHVTSSQLTLDSGVISIRRVFMYVVFCEMIALALMTTGDYSYVAGFAVVLVLPIIVLLIPTEPLIGLPLMLIATGFDSMGKIGSAQEHFTFTYFHVSMATMFIAIIMNMLLNKRYRIPYVSFLTPTLAFLAMMAFSLLYSPNFMVGFMEVVRISVLVLLAYTVVISIDSERRVKIVVWSYILIPALISGYTIYEIVTEGSFFASSVIRVATELGIPVYRSTGTFHNPNILACFLMIGVTVGFGAIITTNKNLIMKLFVILLVSTTAVGVIASFSRAGWLSTMVAVFLIIIIHRRWKYFYIFAAMMMLVLIILSIKFPHILLSTFDRFISIFDPLAEESSSSRISLIKTGIWMWQDHPLFGVGAGSHPYYAPFYTDPNMPPLLLWVVEPHTIQTKILAEEGIIGITIASWFFFTVLFDNMRSLKTMSSVYLKHIQVAFIALFIGFIVNFTFGADMFNNSFWISLGVLYAIPIADANEQAQKKAVFTVPDSTNSLPAG